MTSLNYFKVGDRVKDRSDRPGTIAEMGTGIQTAFCKVRWGKSNFANRPRYTWMRFDRLTKLEEIHQ